MMKWMATAAVSALLLVLPPAILAADMAAVTSSVEVQKWQEDEGSVAVMSNGTILVHFDYGETFVLELSDVGEYGVYWSRRAGWHIDKTRGSPRSKQGSAFEQADSYDSDPLFKLAGTVTIEVHMDGVPTMLVGVQGDGESFRHEFQLNETTNPLSPEYEGSGSVAAGETGTTCSASCSNGSGTVTCNGRQGCYAYCDTSGSPQVGCGKRASVIP
jgi:hypothetical protein